MGDGMNRREFLWGFAALCGSLFTRRSDGDDDDGTYLLYGLLAMRDALGCVPIPGATLFRLDVSTLDGGHLLACW